MTDKEATVFIIDLGLSMGGKHGREETDLDFSLRYLFDKLSNIIATGRKTLLVGLLGLRTDETRNAMQEDEGYENVTVLQPIQQMLLSDLRCLPGKLRPSGTDNGDALSAVILGVDMILKHCRHLKFIKHLYLLTNGSGALDAEDLESTAKQIVDSNIKFTVLGVDFDDPEYGFKEEDKPFGKADHEKNLKKLVELTNGTFGTMAEAVGNLEIPYVKSTKPIVSYKGQLRLGGPEDDTTITIDIERYPKTMIRRPPTASSFVVKDVIPSQSATQMDADDNDMTAVKVAYSYRVKDEESATGYRDVPREELARGYEYGRTAVHISETDENVTKLETMQSYDILGFIPKEAVERYMMMGTTHMLLPSSINDKAAFALSSMVHGLHNRNSCAVARFVQKDLKEPMMVVLSPLIESDYECLIENDLPYAEDLRVYRFPPLDKVYTVGGQVKTDHIKLPSDKLMNAMSTYVDSMSLMDGETERFAIEDVYSPLFHTIEQAIKARAINPDAELPEKPRIVLEPSKVPADIKERSNPALTKLIQTADVKKVPAKVKGRAKWRQKESDKPLSNLDIDALFDLPGKQNGTGAKKSVKIDPLNAIPEFKRLMQTVDDEAVLKSGVDQMGKIAEDLVSTSFGDVNYSQAIEILGLVRTEMIELEMPELYNAMLKHVKQQVIAEKLNGNRWDFWQAVKTKRRLGFISDEESETSDLSSEKAQQLMSLKS